MNDSKRLKMSERFYHKLFFTELITQTQIYILFRLKNMFSRIKTSQNRSSDLQVKNNPKNAQSRKKPKNEICENFRQSHRGYP